MEESRHITVEEIFDVAHSMYETLHKSCPGCSMAVVSAVISMLVIEYMKDYEKQKEIFPHEEWIKDITEHSMRAIDRYEHMDSSVQ